MKELDFPENISALTFEAAFDVLAKARALEAKGTHVVHLEIGEPDFPTPPHVAQAGIDAIKAGLTTYTQVDGLPDFRETIANHVRTYKKVKAQADEIMVTPGGKPVMFFTILALIRPGDEVLCPDPGFGTYSAMVGYAGGVPVYYGLREENNFRIDYEEIESLTTPKTKLMIINSPNNPTGGMLTGSDLAALSQLALKNEFFVLSDEIYDRIYYGEKPVSIATIPGMKDQTIILDGFSKAYSMTGWRLGYMVANKNLIDVVKKMMVNSVSCTPPFTQMAGKKALEGPQDCLHTMVAEFRKRRDFIVAGLNAIPRVSCLLPEGAFYAFANVKEIGLAGKQLEKFFLEKAATAIVAGSAFGDNGEGYIRISYANSMENLEIALNRIEQAVKEL